MTKYKCSRIVIERAQSAFWSTDDHNADTQLARDAGASTLEEYLQFFADKAHREDLIIRAQISGEPLEVLRLFFPWLGSHEPVNAADQVDALNELYDALQPPAGINFAVLIVVTTAKRRPTKGLFAFCPTRPFTAS